MTPTEQGPLEPRRKLRDGLRMRARDVVHLARGEVAKAVDSSLSWRRREESSMAPKRIDPVVHKRRLKNELRQAREASGRTRVEVAAAMEWSPSKLNRIESGSVNITTNDLRALLDYYGITDRKRLDGLVDLARAAREPSWWTNYNDIVTPEYQAFLGFESSASVIRAFEPLFVPGLLQVREYARAVTKAASSIEVKELEALVDLRIERQQILGRSDSPETHFILDEAVIHRVVGDPEIMRGQLRHIRELSEHPSVTTHIVPFRHGNYPALERPYVLFEFSDINDDEIGFLEMSEGDLIVRDSSTTSQMSYMDYLAAFWHMEQLTVQEDTSRLIDDAITRLGR